MRVVIADFETFSSCDLKKAGAWRYAEDISTNIICLAFQVGQEPVQLWHPGADGRALADLVAAGDVMWVAHNVQFERAIWKRIMTPVHGFAPIPDDRWHDTMAVAAYKALPLSLDRVSMALRLPTQKDKEGSRLTISLSRTNKAGNYEHTPEKLQRVYDYCKTDIAGEAELHKRIGWLSREEREVWKLDQKINERGVCLDMEFVNAAQQVCDDATRPLLKEFRALTGIDKLRSPMLKEWLVKQGCPFPRDSEGKPDTSLDKEHIAKLLGVQDDEDDSLAGDEDDYEESDPQSALPYSYRRPLEILRVIGSASIKKLAAMQACVCADGQARGLLQYHGAGPGRWAGRLLQPQNFPRPTLKQVVGWKENGEEIIGGHDADALVGAILSRDAEFVRCLYGEPIEAVASGLRHALVARPGYTFEVGDFAKIECVIVLAMAGAADTAAKVIKAGSAVYTDMAAKVFRRPVKKTDLKEYTIGKNIVLGCGFQMGWKKFRSRYAQDQPVEFCKGAIDEYRINFAPEVPLMWKGLERAAVTCVWERRATEAYGITYQLEDGWLTARLPSGRKLHYYDPKPVRKAMPWDENDIRRSFEYSAQKMGQWKRINAYGGLLVENVTQATARDLLVHGMFNCERERHPLVLTVHDEAITEVESERADAKLLEQYMTDIPQWAKQLRIPVAAECWIGDRYKK